MQSLVPQNQFKNPKAALSALELHPIYRWLRRELPRVLKVIPADQPAARFQLVQLLLQYMTIAMMDLATTGDSKARSDKHRTAAWNAVDRVEAFMADHTIALAPPRNEVLAKLLVEARSELMQPVTKKFKAPALLGLAHALHAQLNIADTLLLVEVSACLTDKCSIDARLDKRTANRYIKSAREG